MLFRNIAVVAALSVASAAAAQTVVDPQVTPDALRQVRSFENSLRKAIELAGSQLGDRARQAVPDVELRFETQPIAQGYILPTGEGILFAVEVPGIEATSAMLYERYVKLLQQQYSNTPRVGNTSPPTPPTAGPTLGALITEPEKEYRDLTRQALVDTMLDLAFALPLKENQSLTLSVGTILPGSGQPAGPVAEAAVSHA